MYLPHFHILISPTKNTIQNRAIVVARILATTLVMIHASYVALTVACLVCSPSHQGFSNVRGCQKNDHGNEKHYGNLAWCHFSCFVFVSCVSGGVGCFVICKKIKHEGLLSGVHSFYKDCFPHLLGFENWSVVFVENRQVRASQWCEVSKLT